MSNLNHAPRSRGYRHAYLLISLLLVITVRPFLAERLVGLALVDILLGLTLVLGVAATARSRIQFGLISSIVAGSVVARIIWERSQDESWMHVFLLGYIVFYSAVAVLVAKSLFRPGARISFDSLCGAFSVYLLIGVIWTMVYVMLESLSPNSFSFNFVGEAAAYSERFDRLLGFSFTTLTTVGYGNVAPVTPKADSLAVLEAVVGQIYLAVVIARLVAMQLTQDMGTGSDPDSK